MAKTSFYLLVNQTAGEKACKKTAGKEDLFDDLVSLLGEMGLDP